MGKRRTALVTGASSGLGAEFARLLAKEKHDLVLVARNEERLTLLKSELESRYGVAAHVCTSDLSRIDAALDVFSFTRARDLEIDVLINNAGFGDSGDFADRDWQRQYEMLQVNIIALMQLTRCFLPGMIERKRGGILNVASVAAFCAGPGMSVYYASKAFARSFSEAVAEEVRGAGVTVTALCPGPTSTGFEAAAGLGKGSMMFKNAARPEDVVRAGIRALRKGRTLCYPGVFPKGMGFLCRLAPRALTRKCAGRLDK